MKKIIVLTLLLSLFQIMSASTEGYKSKHLSPVNSDLAIEVIDNNTNHGRDYYIMSDTLSLEYDLEEGYEIYGFVRTLASNDLEPDLHVYIDDAPTILLSLSDDKSVRYTSKEHSDLSIAKRVEISPQSKACKVRLSTSSKLPLLIRMYTRRVAPLNKKKNDLNTVNAETSINFSNKITYSDNVFQLSEDDLDSHDAGSSFDYIETSDDVINISRLSIYHRIQRERLRYDFHVSGTYNTYLKNTDKTKPAISAGFGLRDSNFNTSIMYGYYPDNYVRKYRDKDGTEEYEKFVYDKNLYKFDIEYRFTRKAYVLGYLKYEQYYHNEYFTEYDGEVITPGLGLKYSFNEMYLEGWYYYRDYETNDDIHPEDEVSDQSYESNIYSVQLRMKRIKTKKFDYRPVFDFRYEKRYYDGWDKYHNGREDDNMTVNPWVKFYLTDYLNITLDYTLRIRNVSSDSQSVEDSKTYQENQLSLSFEVPIKL